MSQMKRALVPLLLVGLLPASTLAQTGPADPQIIAGASTARINVGQRKLVGHVIGTVRVAPDGSVSDVLITENTTESGFEPQLVKVLQSLRFRPAIDAAGQAVAANTEVKVELRQSTGDSPKPVAAKPDPELNDKEKARIRRMRCVDFLWEWDLLREEADNGVTTEFMPRIATIMYASMRSEAGDVIDAKVWKASAKGLREAADRCRETPAAPFWEGVFKPVMDEEVAD